MNLASQQYADLADHSYDRDGNMAELARAKEVVEINGSRYKVLEFFDNPKSGYQGTIYQHVESGAVVVAHRGTEFDREALKDGLIADGGMVFNRANSQTDDAVALTRQAMEHAGSSRNVMTYGRPSEVTVTGHSLGGTLAQITAHHFDLRGETFNPYGAVSLDRRIPEGGERVVNHVMAVDAVSAASPHYGQVRPYATPEEVATLRRAGYHDSIVIDVLRPNLPVSASVMSGGSHSMHNFLPVDGNGRPDVSVLADPAAQRRAGEHQRMILQYRQDVESIRSGVTTASRGPAGLAADAVDWLKGPLEAGEPAAREARERAGREAQQPRARPAEPSSPHTLLDDIRRDTDRSVHRMLYGEDPVQPPLGRHAAAAPEPEAGLRGPAAGADSKSDAVARLLEAARSGDPDAVRGATRSLATHWSWQEQMARHAPSHEGGVLPLASEQAGLQEAAR